MSSMVVDDVTQLLNEWGCGDRAAQDRLLSLVYDHLRQQAAAYMRHERCDHTLQPTALVHEAYCRLVDQTRTQWQSRAHFFAVAAQAMRRILVDHARSRTMQKRGAGAVHVELDETIVGGSTAPEELLALDSALERLATVDERRTKVIELRVFAGLTIPETADVLNVSQTTIITDYQVARAWLYRELHPEPEAPRVEISNSVSSAAAIRRP